MSDQTTAARVIKPPAPVESNGKFSVFLAGSIEMGAARDWQVYMQHMLSELDIDIYNPRRDDWDPTWEQTANNPPFREQVEWELSALKKCEMILMYLQPGTKSPISLLELGLFASSGKLVVCCPEGFWRKGNVDIVCQKNYIKQVKSLELMAEYAINSYKNKMQYKELREQAMDALTEDQKRALSFFPIKMDSRGNLS